MKLIKHRPFTMTLTALVLLGAGSAQAYSNDASFDQVAANAWTGHASEWHNFIMPEASGDYVASDKPESADDAMNRVVQTYSPGFESKWHNFLVPEASGDYIFEVEQISADERLNNLAPTYARVDSKWINPIVPEASADYIEPHDGTSGNEQFMRQVAYYTREMLDRGGWTNPYVSDSNYSAPYELLAAEIGEGVTTGTT